MILPLHFHPVSFSSAGSFYSQEMAFPNRRNFQVSGLGVRGHCWVEAAIIGWLGNFLCCSINVQIMVSSHRNPCANLRGNWMKIYGINSAERRKNGHPYLYLSWLYVIYYSLLSSHSSSFSPVYFFLHSLLFASLLSNNDSRDRFALWLTQCHIWL